jgi:hypothetical protein
MHCHRNFDTRGPIRRMGEAGAGHHGLSHVRGRGHNGHGSQAGHFGFDLKATFLIGTSLGSAALPQRSLVFASDRRQNALR